MVYVDLDEKKEVDAGADNSVSAKTSVLVPKIVSVICSELSRRHLGQEGLFRKSGSSFRQKQLRDALECASPEAWVNIVRGNSTSGGGSDVVVSGLDLAAILNQWLRELPEPLIPRKFQLLFIEHVVLRANLLILHTCIGNTTTYNVFIAIHSVHKVIFIFVFITQKITIFLDLITMVIHGQDPGARLRSP